MKFGVMHARIFDTPLLITQSKLDVILEVLAPRMDFETPQHTITAVDGKPLTIEDLRFQRFDRTFQMYQQQGQRIEYNDAGFMVADGTAIIPVLGTLVHRGSMMDSLSGVQSYQDVKNMVSSALNDSKVQSILLDIDSPGGESSGAFDLADYIYEARGNKPITAVASEHAASAAYLIASAADEIAVPRTGSVGSIGVVTAHMDMSKALEKKGIAVTYTYAGKKKIDGNKTSPPSDSYMADVSEVVQDVYGLFTDTVARNRGMATADVRGTEAGTYMGRKGVEIGLADRVNTMGNEISNSQVRQPGMFRISQQRKEIDMAQQATHSDPAQPHTPSNPVAPQPGAQPVQPTPTQPTQPAQPAPAQPAQPVEQPPARPRASDERERIRAITTHAEAEGRTELASHLAFETDMSVEAAVAAMKVTPKQTKNRLDTLMAARQPNISSQENKDTVEAAPMPSSSSTYDGRVKDVQAARSR